MKKTLKIGLILAGAFFLTGCVNQPKANEKQATPKEIVVHETNDNNGAIQAPKITPKQVVEEYVKYTLKDENINNTRLAKPFLSSELQVQFDAAGFVPKKYGIQNNPESVKISEANINGSKAIVKVTGQYYKSQVIWEFTLDIQGGEWKISDIKSI